MDFAADDFETIAIARRRIRREEDLPDDDWRTAETHDLDAVGDCYGLSRNPTETDASFRLRIADVAEKMRPRWSL